MPKINEYPEISSAELQDLLIVDNATSGTRSIKVYDMLSDLYDLVGGGPFGWIFFAVADDSLDADGIIKLNDAGFTQIEYSCSEQTPQFNTAHYNTQTQVDFTITNTGSDAIQLRGSYHRNFDVEYKSQVIPAGTTTPIRILDWTDESGQSMPLITVKPTTRNFYILIDSAN